MFKLTGTKGCWQWPGGRAGVTHWASACSSISHVGGTWDLPWGEQFGQVCTRAGGSLETSLLLSLSRIEGNSEGGESLVTLPGVLWVTGTLALPWVCVWERWGLEPVSCGAVCSGHLEHFCLVNCLWFALSLPCAVYIFLCHTPDQGSLHFKHCKLIWALAGSGLPYWSLETLHGKAEVILQLSRASCLWVFNF